MSWAGGILQAGMGNVPGEMGFASVTDTDPFVINAASFTSDSNSNWMFNAEEGKLTSNYNFTILNMISLFNFLCIIQTGLNYIVQTGKGTDLQKNWLTTHGHVFTFKVKACNNAMVALGSPALPGYVAYNITIGRNMSTFQNKMFIYLLYFKY